ncbi:MAG: acyl carrier protein [Anaerolineales bacterium]|nr:acyl carrier protein [Anaerolineales bacterium]
MDADRYREEIRRLTSEVLRLPETDIPDALSFGDVPQWDSLGHMDLLMALEERYKVELNEDLIANLLSLEAICQYLAEHAHA